MVFMVSFAADVYKRQRPLPELPEEPKVPPRRVNLIIDIQERMAQGKGPAYNTLLYQQKTVETSHGTDVAGTWNGNCGGRL